VFTGAFALLGTRILKFCTGQRHAAQRGGLKNKNTVKKQIQKARTMRGARGRLGMTQFDLARRVRCSESQIAKIETGRATPEDWLKEAIARELNIQTYEVGV